MSDRLYDFVRALSARPADLSLRLDLADYFQERRKVGLANWMRLSLARSAAAADINVTFPTLSVWGNICYAPFTQVGAADPINRWQEVCPDYWKTPKVCAYNDYYGRWLISCAATSYPVNRAAVDELASMLWLERLWKNGLLELVEYEIGNGETAEWALDLPPEIRGLPFFLNTARSFDSLNKNLSRRILAWDTLVGLYITPRTFAKGILAELPTLAAGLQFMSIEAVQRSSDFDGLIDGIKLFADLRLVLLCGQARLSLENFELLAQSPTITALGILSEKLDRKGLFALGQAPKLRWLGINSASLTRRDLNEFRKEFPKVTVLLSQDMQLRVGPA